MSWLFSQALVAEYSEATSWDGAPSAPLSVMPTQHKFYRNDKTMEPLKLSQFGLTCAVLTEGRGEELLTWFREGFRARTFQQQETDQVSPEQDLDFGEKWRESSGEVRPRVVFVENSPLLVGRGLAMVLGDLAEMGYDAQWCIVSASDTGAPHQRDRCWIVANDNRVRESQPAREQQEREAMAYTNKVGRIGRAGSSGSEGWIESKDSSSQIMADSCGEHGEGIFTSLTDSEVGCGQVQRQVGSCGNGFRRWPAEPSMGRVVNGLANRVDRIKALGNGQVPRVAAAAFNILTR